MADDTKPKDKSAPTQDELKHLLFANLEAIRDGTLSPQMTDALTQALLLLLGSGPSMAAYDALLHAQEANGILFHNAVANQQKTNLLGMAMTAKCVRYMLDGAPDSHALDEMLHEQGAGS